MTQAAQTIDKKIALIMYLRGEGIQDQAVLNAIETIPREEFIPDSLKPQAWEDTALPIGRGQTISQPFIVAAMTEALDLSDQDKVLEIGTGCGYQAAVLSKLCRRVYTIERHKPLHEEALIRLEGLGLRNITAICADGMQGWPTIHGIDQAPFDKIIVTAAARAQPPPALIEQLKPGGIMVMPIGERGNQMLKLFRKETEQTYTVQDLMPVRFVPLLPEVEN